MKFKLSFLATAALVFLLSACVKDKVSSVVANYDASDYAELAKSLNLPGELEDYFPQFNFDSDHQTVSNHRATLGRVLFYDKRLSANNTIACANCHKQDKAFSDDVAFSKGFQGELTERNSLALGAVLDFETSYGGSSFGGGSRFFWDHLAGSIPEQSTQTLQNPIEMGANLNTLADELLQEKFYRILFEKAFPDGSFTPGSQQILAALETFINAISSANSKFDQGLKNAAPESHFVNFTAEENMGKDLFMANCASCHGSDMARVNEVAASNGLEQVYTDKGIGGLSGNSLENGVFKVPMLRNVALTGPFMHDGSLATLEDVVEHYSSGIKNHSNLHANLRDDLNPRQFNFSGEQKAALAAFLHTLTDVSTIQQPRFSNPFK